MNKVLVLSAAAVLLSTAAFANTITVTVGPQATYLHLQNGTGGNGADTGVGPVVIDLFAQGLSLGQSIVIRSGGQMCFNTVCNAGTQVNTLVIGAFSNSNVIGASINAARITALATLLPALVSSPTFDQLQATDIANDFSVAFSSVAFTGTTVNVAGQYLILGIHDSRYVDNSDPGGDVFAAVDFTPAGVPEPATVGMIGAGLLALGMIARRRK
jgi:hypothetical protein